MRYAIEIKETLKRTIIVEADNFNKADSIVYKAYKNHDIELNAENSHVSVELGDNSDKLKTIFTKKEFEALPLTEGIKYE